MITIDDVRKAGHCVRGARAWFEDHKLDFNKFLNEGVEESVFLATGDAFAQQVVEHKNRG